MRGGRIAGLEWGKPSNCSQVSTTTFIIQQLQLEIAPHLQKRTSDLSYSKRCRESLHFKTFYGVVYSSTKKLSINSLAQQLNDTLVPSVSSP